MTNVTPNLNLVVNHAWNLTALRANVKLGARELARGDARRVEADRVANHALLESVVGPWRGSALQQSVARFGAGQDADLPDVLPEVNRLKAAIPDLHVRLIERLFSVTDAITAEFEKRFLATLNDRQGLIDLKAWLEGRLNLFREISAELRTNVGSIPTPIELKNRYPRYHSSYWQVVCILGVSISLIDDNNISSDELHEVYEQLKSSGREQRVIDEGHSFFVTSSRREFVYDLVGELCCGAKNQRWETGVLVFDLPLGACPAATTDYSVLKDLSWPPQADDFRLLSYQRVSGFKLGFKVVGDKVRVSIDFGKTLRTR